jgi:hypothetical protein
MTVGRLARGVPVWHTNHRVMDDGRTELPAVTVNAMRYSVGGAVRFAHPARRREKFSGLRYSRARPVFPYEERGLVGVVPDEVEHRALRCRAPSGGAPWAVSWTWGVWRCPLRPHVGAGSGRCGCGGLVGALPCRLWRVPPLDHSAAGSPRGTRPFRRAPTHGQLRRARFPRHRVPLRRVGPAFDCRIPAYASGGGAYPPEWLSGSFRNGTLYERVRTR